MERTSPQRGGLESWSETYHHNKNHKLLRRGCKGFLCNIVEIKEAEPSFQDIPVVPEFLDVFWEEIPSMSPLMEAEFCIDLAPGATPMSGAPYRMAPAELKDLKTQLELTVQKTLYPAQYVSMGSPGIVREKKRMQP